MAVKQFSDNLIQITRMVAMNCYLVREDDGFTLVDTSMPGTEKIILHAATAHSGSIRRILLTHAHVDHVGSLDALKKILPDAEVYMSEREAPLMAGDMSLLADEPQDPPKGGFPDVETTPDHLLNPGDRVGSLEVYAAPGHTPGQVAFLDTRDRTLIAGDSFHTLWGTRVTGDLNLLFPLPTFATWHKPTSLKTAKSLHALNPSRLATGHGKVLENPGPTMQEAIQRAERNFSG